MLLLYFQTFPIYYYRAGRSDPLMSPTALSDTAISMRASISILYGNEVSMQIDGRACAVTRRSCAHARRTDCAVTTQWTEQGAAHIAPPTCYTRRIEDGPFRSWGERLWGIRFGHELTHSAHVFGTAPSARGAAAYTVFFRDLTAVRTTTGYLSDVWSIEESGSINPTPW